MNELDRTFSHLKKKRRPALIAYLAAGYPGFSEQANLIRIMEEEGVDILELGVPFSDPIADGPTIQFASQQSLNRGTTLRKILAWIGTLRREIRLPIVLMSYLNPILAYGLKDFSRDAGRAGVSGLIVPDLIPEESEELRTALSARGIYLIHLIAPTTPPERERFAGKKSRGFLYAVSVTGVTGARAKFPPETRRWLAGLKRLTKRPVCVGFGISGPEQIKALRGAVDGIIVGSAIIDVLRKNTSQKRPKELRAFVRKLANACGRKIYAD